MEQVSTWNDSLSPPPIAGLAAPRNQPDPLLFTPNRRPFDPEYPSWPQFQYTDNDSHSSSPRSQDPSLADPSVLEPSRSNPLVQGFERPSLSHIAILVFLCFAAYPAFYILTSVAKDKSLFTVRLLVAMWCSGVGFALGYVLLRIGVKHLEAATWATVIHMSYKGGGMKLRDLAGGSRNPTNFLSALRILLSRFGNQETARHSRHAYERPWSLILVFFIILAILGPLLPFLFGRIMVIETFVSGQRTAYREILITGDLSQEDVDHANAQLWAVQGFAQTWPLLPYGTSTSGVAEFTYKNETIYFAQPSPSQFIPGGLGSGTFNTKKSTSVDLRNTPIDPLALTSRNASKSGTILRYPQWGTKIHCEKLPSPQVNLIPLSNQSFTYAFLPQDFLRGLFGTYGIGLPTQLAWPDLQSLHANDTIPSNIDPSTISILVKWWDNGLSLNLFSRYVIDGELIGDQGWVTIEVALVRLNTTFAPSGSFPVYSNPPVPDLRGVETRIGYDVVVCVQKYEPWIVEAYNTSTGSPLLRIVGKDSSTSLSPNGNIQGAAIDGTRHLNTTGKNPAFFVAHDDGVGQMTKENLRDLFYGPSPTTVSFTDGDGPGGYTQLSPDRFGVIRARTDAINTLPFLAGSAPVVAQSYTDRTLAYVTYEQWQLICLPVLILVLGIVGELFVPKLPLNIPRRGFGVYSWLVLLQCQELQFEKADGLDKLMNLDEFEKKMSDIQIKFVA